MSVNVYELKEKIMAVIRNNDYDLDDLREFLGPVYEFINAPNFVMHIKEIVEEILKDRDGNNKFNIDDLKILKDDVLAITTLVNAVLLVIGSIPEFKLKYESGATEELVFKVFGFIFLVVIPKETGNPWNEVEKERVVDVTLSIYNVIRSSQITKDIVDKIVKWFQKKGWCKCLSTEQDKEEVVAAHMPQMRAEIHSAFLKEKDTLRMQREIAELKAELEELKK